MSETVQDTRARFSKGDPVEIVECDAATGRPREGGEVITAVIAKANGVFVTVDYGRYATVRTPILFDACSGWATADRERKWRLRPSEDRTFAVMVTVRMTPGQYAAYLRQIQWDDSPGHYADIAAWLPEDVADTLRQGCPWLAEFATLTVTSTVMPFQASGNEEKGQ